MQASSISLIPIVRSSATPAVAQDGVAFEAAWAALRQPGPTPAEPAASADEPEGAAEEPAGATEVPEASNVAASGLIPTLPPPFGPTEAKALGSDTLINGDPQIDPVQMTGTTGQASPADLTAQETEVAPQAASDEAVYSSAGAMRYAEPARAPGADRGTHRADETSPLPLSLRSTPAMPTSPYPSAALPSAWQPDAPAAVAERVSFVPAVSASDVDVPGFGIRSAPLAPIGTSRGAALWQLSDGRFPAVQTGRLDLSANESLAPAAAGSAWPLSATAPFQTAAPAASQAAATGFLPPADARIKADAPDIPPPRPRLSAAAADRAGVKATAADGPHSDGEPKAFPITLPESRRGDLPPYGSAVSRAIPPLETAPLNGVASTGGSLPSPAQNVIQTTTGRETGTPGTTLPGAPAGRTSALGAARPPTRSPLPGVPTRQAGAHADANVAAETAPRPDPGPKAAPDAPRGELPDLGFPPPPTVASGSIADDKAVAAGTAVQDLGQAASAGTAPAAAVHHGKTVDSLMTAPHGTPHLPHRQVADAIVRTRNGVVEIQLDPVELGRVTVLLGTDHRASLGIIAERPETLDLMRRHSDQLLQDLKDNGMPDARLDFMRQHGQQSDGRSSGGGRHDQSRNQAETPQSLQTAAMPLAAVQPSPGSPNRIDIRL